MWGYHMGAILLYGIILASVFVVSFFVAKYTKPEQNFLENSVKQKETKIKKIVKWYQKTWIIVLFIIFFFPVGLFLMWKYTDWKKPIKIVVTIVLVVMVFIAGKSGVDINKNNSAISANFETYRELLIKNSNGMITDLENYQNGNRVFTIIVSNDWYLANAEQKQYLAEEMYSQVETLAQDQISLSIYDSSSHLVAKSKLLSGMKIIK